MAIIDPLFSILDCCECNRLASEIFLNGLQTELSRTLFRGRECYFRNKEK